jgi:hypothetical protein
MWIKAGKRDVAFRQLTDTDCKLSVVAKDPADLYVLVQHGITPITESADGDGLEALPSFLKKISLHRVPANTMVVVTIANRGQKDADVTVGLFT